MRASIILALASIIFVCALVVGAQAMTTGTNAPQGKITNEVQAHEIQKEPQGTRGTDVKLKKRDIRLTITPVRYSDTVFEDVPAERYKVGEMVKIKMEMTNLMPVETEVVFGDYYFQNRFRLVKDGTPVPYRGDVQKTLKRADEAVVIIGSRYPSLLPPNIPVEIGVMPLNYWYDSLEPGRYELTMRHRFWRKEQPVESNTVTFEIVP